MKYPLSDENFFSVSLATFFKGLRIFKITLSVYQLTFFMLNKNLYVKHMIDQTYRNKNLFWEGLIHKLITYPEKSHWANLII